MHHEYVVDMWRRYLRCGEEDVVRYVAYSAGYDTQSDSREDVGVVSLAGVEGAAVSQRHLVERTSTGENAPALKKSREEEEDERKQKLRVTSLELTERCLFD